MSERITLVIDKRDTTLRMENKTLRINLTDSFKRFPVSMLKQIIIYGSPTIRCDVWRALSEHNVPVAIIPIRGKGNVCWLGSGLSSFVHYRISQHATYRDPKKRLEMARWVLTEKFTHYQKLMNNSDETSQQYHAQLSQAMDNLPSCDTISQLMGVEGAAARAGVAWLKTKIHKRWQFEGRNRRPPTDPVNSLLSLGYTLALAEARGQVAAAGLDPGLGFLHEPAPARESLALDLMEPLRAGVDAFVLSLLDCVLKPEHFTVSTAEGCRMNKEARALFYAAWGVWREDWPPQSDDDSSPKTLSQVSRNLSIELRNHLSIEGEGYEDFV